MNSYIDADSDYPHYQPEHPYHLSQKPPRRPRNFNTAFLFIIGLLLGVILINTFGPTGKYPASGRRSQDVIEAQLFQRNADSLTTEYEKALVKATQTAIPAVVSIYTSATVYYRFSHPIYDMLYGPQRKEINAMGSGVIIDPGGTIISNDHVISGAKNISGAKLKVVLADGRRFDAKIEKAFPGQDLAILSIDGKNLPSLEFGSSETLLPGQTVLALGNPFGVSRGGKPTVTQGIISATSRSLSLTTDDQSQKYLRNLIQTDASINEGNSGGALVDISGRLVGINTAILSEGAGFIGLGFAIPIDRVKIILESVRKNIDITQVETGIKVQPLTPAIANALKFDGEDGIVVSEVETRSTGEKGGFKKGDIITGIDGFNIVSLEQAKNMFQGAIPGEIYFLEVFRNGEYVNLSLEIARKR